MKRNYQSADILREVSLAFESDGDISTAYKIMKEALILRPTGSVLKSKVTEYKKLLEGKENV